MLGGIEFPIINYEHFSGKKYDHFWGVGFGAIWQDRIYHVQYSTLKRWVWMVKGYHPSEPVFVQDPSRNNEDAGVLLSLVSPLSDESLKVFNFYYFSNLTFFFSHLLSFLMHMTLLNLAALTCQTDTFHLVSTASGILVYSKLRGGIFRCQV